MASFQFRLAKVLDWYEKQSELEAERLRRCNDLVEAVRASVDRHLKEVAARQTELIQSPHPNPSELAALGPFRRRAKQTEILLRRKLESAEQELVRQRTVTQSAQMRLKLVEKLRERRLSEHHFQAEKALEELASESHLAGFARALR